MTLELIECSPNFSDGRRPEVLAAIEDAVRSSGVTVLGTQADAEQNRSVIRFVGEPDAVEQAASAAAGVAAALIDMDEHRGAYPRIGATDVIPLVPLSGIDMEDCAARARLLGERLARELDLPVYLYGEAALRGDRADLSVIRAGEYEALKERIAVDPSRAPDFGPARIGSAGATAVGARHPRVEITLRIAGGSSVGEAVASAVSRASGGLCDVEAWSLHDDRPGESTVLARLTRPARTPVHRVVELARVEADRHGGRLLSTSLSPMVPESVLHEAATYYLMLDEADTVEQALRRSQAGPHGSDAGARGFLEAVAHADHSVGEGASSAYAAALSAALLGMAAGLALAQARNAAAADILRRLRTNAAEHRLALMDLMDMGAAATAAVATALALPTGTATEADARRDAVQQALSGAVEVPMALLRRSVSVLHDALAAAENVSPGTLVETGVAAYLAAAAARAAALSVAARVSSLRDLEEGDRYRQECAALLREANETAEAVERAVRSRAQV